jgi:hypothetical protein
MRFAKERCDTAAELPASFLDAAVHIKGNED